MKSFRVWLLVLLTVLLPLRGALAAAMMCPVAGAAGQTGVQIAERAHDHGHSHGHPTSGDHAASAHHAGPELATQDADHHDLASVGDPSDKCNLCSAFCSVTGMVSGRATTAEPRAVVIGFPHRYAPPSSFIPDGQERPPRTI